MKSKRLTSATDGASLYDGVKLPKFFKCNNHDEEEIPKKNSEWLNWISQGKLLYTDTQEIQATIDKLRMNPMAFAYVNLDNVAKIVENFENQAHDGGEGIIRYRRGADFVERDPVIARATYEKRLQTSINAGLNARTYGIL